MTLPSKVGGIEALIIVLEKIQKELKMTILNLHGRNWSSHQLPPSLLLYSDPVPLDTFNEKIKSLFDLDDEVKLELFDRTLPEDDRNDVNVVQVMIYQEGLPYTYRPLGE